MASYIQRFKSVWLLFVEDAECWKLTFMWTYHIVFKNRKVTSKEQLLIYQDKSSIMSSEIFSKVVQPFIEGGGCHKTLMWNKASWIAGDELLFHSCWMQDAHAVWLPWQLPCSGKWFRDTPCTVGWTTYSVQWVKLFVYMWPSWVGTFVPHNRQAEVLKYCIKQKQGDY
jgi:hypothetical protein